METRDLHYQLGLPQEKNLGCVLLTSSTDTVLTRTLFKSLDYYIRLPESLVKISPLNLLKSFYSQSLTDVPLAITYVSN